MLLKVLLRLLSVLPLCGIMMAIAQCTPNTQQQSQGPATGSSDLKASNYTSPSIGNGHRCDEIYPDVYDVAEPIVTSLAVREAKLQQLLRSGKKAGHLDPPIRPYRSTPVQENILKGVITMIRNMMISEERPIHPVAFFSVVKDIESSTARDRWSGGNKEHERYGHEDFLFTSRHCVKGCSGYFQVDVNIEGSLWHYQNVCGKNGLDILGLKGSADFCAFFFWFLQAGGGYKCTWLHPQDNTPPFVNPCTDRNYTWTPDTFAFAGRDAYRQAAPYDGDSSKPWWKLIYTGFDNNGFHQGYEHCSVEHYLKTYWSAPKDWRAPENLASTYPELVRASVRQFAYNVGLLPLWANDWVPTLDPPVANTPGTTTPPLTSQPTAPGITATPQVGPGSSPLGFPLVPTEKLRRLVSNPGLGNPTKDIVDSTRRQGGHQGGKYQERVIGP